jgi:hypothetical protein
MLWSDLAADLRDGSSEGPAGDAAARAILLLLERGTIELGELAPDATLCPACGTPCASIRSPYCGEDCRERSGFVRQLRQGLESGALADRERQSVLGQILWRLLGGGNPLRIAMVPERALAKVYARTGGLCELCRAPATAIDHIATACNRPINLRPVCAACATTRPLGDPDLLERADSQALLDELATRIHAVSPLRACDDAATWDWRTYVNARKASSPSPACPAS